MRLRLAVVEDSSLIERAQIYGSGTDLFEHHGGYPGGIAACRERHLSQITALRRHVAGGIERGRTSQPAGTARERVRVPRGEEQRLLAPHAASEHVDALHVDRKPGQRLLHDARQPGPTV